MNHSLLPSKANATLPAKYEAAKLALAECNRIDECKDWEDKMAAMASYAKQADDKSLELTALRIRARAANRCGELYAQIEKGHGKNNQYVQGKVKEGGTPPFQTRKDVAESIGHSPDQMKQKIRIANIPEAEFEALIESDSPPTLTELENLGKRKGKPVYEQRGMTEKAWKAGMYFRGHLEDMAAHTKEFDPQDVVDGSTPEQRKEIRRNIKTIEGYLTKLKSNL